MLNGFGLSKAREPSRTSAGPGGGRGSRHRVGSRIGVIFAIGLLFVFFAVPTQAVNATGLFELDGNAVTLHGAGSPDDWDRVCHDVTDNGTVFNKFGTGFDSAGHAFSAAGCNSAASTTGASALEFVHAASQNEVNFTGGGSKDPIDISSWAYTTGTGGNPGKDILLDGFAARYSTAANSSTCPTINSDPICKLIFFGLDRFDNSGDAQNGFWFLQNSVTLANNKVGGGLGFSGLHKTGDILVVTDFAIGGATNAITVYSWDPGCTKATGTLAGDCGDANLRIAGTSANANCTNSSPTAPFCGIVNQADGTTGPTTAPWGFLDKGGSATYGQGEFFEAGLNISDVPGLNANACFASTLAESRSSTSTSAVLKVFILGGFGACTSSTVTTPSAGKNGSAPINATANLPETDSATITVAGTSNFGGTVKFSICGPFALGTTTNCATGGSAIGSPVTVTGSSGTATVVSPTATVTEVGRYCWRAEYSGDPSVGVPPSSDPTNPSDLSTNECFSVTPLQPTLATQATITSSANPPVDGNLPATISDTATLAGTANEQGTGGVGLDGSIGNPTLTLGSPAKGQITLTAFGPNNCTTVAFGPTTVNANGDGTYGPVSFSPTAVGTYTWVASYSGDSPNTLGVAASACPDTTGTENVTAKDTSSAISSQTWIPNDTATVSSGSGSGTLNGTLTLQAYTSSDCTTGVVSSQSYTQPVVNASAATISSNNTGQFTVSGSGTHTVSWLVTFTPNAGSNVSGSSHCESTSLTITN